MPSPVAVSAVSGPAVSGQGVRLTDASGLHKVLVRQVSPTVAFGLTARPAEGVLALGYGYDEVLLLAESAPEPPAPAGAPRSVVDLTHGLSALRLSGSAAPELLSRVCALDLSEAMTPEGTLRCCPLAGLAVVLVRDDVEGERSYLVLVDRSYGQSLYDVLLDAGAEFGLG